MVGRVFSAESPAESGPSMLTSNEQVIRQDCLGYFMERFPLPHLQQR